jgi:hypothetical protein
VLVQDGVYWVEMDPQHEVSRLLISVFGVRYLEWAEKQRRAVREIEQTTTNRQIHALDVGAQAALASVKSDTVPMRQLLQTLVSEMQHLRREVAETKTQYTQQQLHTTRTLLLTQSGRARLQLDHPTTVTGATRARMVEICPRPSSMVPYFPPELPGSLQRLLEEHLQYKLEDYKGLSKKDWGKGVAMALSRRSYLYRLIAAKAAFVRSGNDLAFKMQEAARQLDDERGTMSVYKFYMAKKRSDETRQKRKVNPVEGGGGRKRQRRGGIDV